MVVFLTPLLIVIGILLNSIHELEKCKLIEIDEDGFTVRPLGMCESHYYFHSSVLTPLLEAGACMARFYIQFTTVNGL